MQRGKAPEDRAYRDGHDLLSVDRTGTLSSGNVHCANCCEKHRRYGSAEHDHRMLATAVMHPEHREVFPLSPGPIRKSDGSVRNDCERESAKRLIEDVRREHPQLQLIVVEDGLASNGLHVRQLREYEMRFIPSAKLDDHGPQCEAPESNPRSQDMAVEDRNAGRHAFRFLEAVALNRTNKDLVINVPGYRKTKPDGRHQHFTG